jgi:hypothetical protein
LTQTHTHSHITMPPYANLFILTFKWPSNTVRSGTHDMKRANTTTLLDLWTKKVKSVETEGGNDGCTTASTSESAPVAEVVSENVGSDYEIISVPDSQSLDDNNAWPDVWTKSQILEFTRKYPWLCASNKALGK